MGMRANISISPEQHEALKTYARQQQTTMSSLVRRAVAAAYGTSDPTRGYVVDGQHTAAARQQEAINRILRGIRR